MSPGFQLEQQQSPCGDKANSQDMDQILLTDKDEAADKYMEHKPQ